MLLISLFFLKFTHGCQFYSVFELEWKILVFQSEKEALEKGKKLNELEKGKTCRKLKRQQEVFIFVIQFRDYPVREMFEWAGEQ